MYLNSTVRLSTAGLGRGFPIGLQQLNFYPRISAADKGDRVELKTQSISSMYSIRCWKFPLDPPPDNVVDGRVRYTVTLVYGHARTVSMSHFPVPIPVSLS